MLAVTRRIPAMDRDVRAGQWPRGLLSQLEGKTLGLIGLGAIGKPRRGAGRQPSACHAASTFGPDKGRADALGAQHVPVEQLLRESDIVGLHLRLSADTQGYLGRERLALMKPTAFLINTARGGLVDKQALIDGVREKRLAGAALDVFHEEPDPTRRSSAGPARGGAHAPQRRHDPRGHRQRRAPRGGEYPALPGRATAGCGGAAAGTVAALPRAAGAGRSAEQAC